MALSWAMHDQAVDLIRLSANTDGRRRDVAVLEAARVAVDSIQAGNQVMQAPALALGAQLSRGEPTWMSFYGVSLV